MDMSVSILDETSVQSGSTNSQRTDFYVYSEKVDIGSRKILPYCPMKMELFNEKYKVIRRIYAAELASAQVVLLEDENGNKYAAKEIFKKKLKNKMFHDFAKNEMALQYSLSRLSRNIVRVEEYYEDEEKYLMIMEFSYEPDYFEDLLENQYAAIANEGLLRLYCYDILNAIKIIHDNGIIHCDIKPQNFLVFHPDVDESVDYIEGEVDNNYLVTACNEENEEVDKIKISDFGLAHILNKDQERVHMLYRAGTIEYKAPEVKDDCYVDRSIDMWSFGISLYKMAVAYFPTAINRYKYGSGPIPFRPADWRDFEGRELIQDLISKCLQMNPTDRITAREALEHPWFKI